MIEVAIVGVVVACLVAWRWYLDAQAKDKDAQRAHELALKSKSVEVDMAAIAEERVKLRKLEERVRSLEFAPSKR